MKLYRYILCTLLSVISLSHCDIIDVMQMSEVEKYITQDTLVIFDLDNTVMEPVQELGNDQWFYHRFEELKKEGDPHHVLNDLLSYWHKIMVVTEMKLVESSTPAFIKSLQDQRRFPVMALTTRSMAISQSTLENLQKLGVNFEESSPNKAPIFFVQGHRYIFYDHGVLFTAGGHKGQALYHFLDTIRYYPKNIVFINDKATHLKEVEVASTDRGVNFIGLRYGFLDEKVRNFQKEVAQVQEKHFKPILSDAEAEKLCREMFLMQE